MSWPIGQYGQTGFIGGLIIFISRILFMSWPIGQYGQTGLIE